MSIVPTGVYDSRTAEAVRQLQKIAGIPQTGLVDYTTWKILCDAAGQIRDQNGSTAPIYPFSHIGKGQKVCAGERSDTVYIIQIMLRALTGYDFEDIPVDGIYGEKTEEAIKEFQRMNALPPSGEVGRETWDRLADSYNISNCSDPH